MEACEEMTCLPQIEKGDLSSFAMLILEPDTNANNRRTPESLLRQKSTRESNRRPTQFSGNYLQQSQNQYYQNRHLSLSIDEPAHPQLSPGCYSPTPPSPSNVSGIKNFFRKRHKSVGSSAPFNTYGGQLPNCEGVPSPGPTSPGPTSPITPPNGNLSNSSSGGGSGTGGGSKLRNLFFGSSKNKQKSSEASYYSVSFQEPTRHSSFRHKPDTVALDSPTTRRKVYSCYGDVIHEGTGESAYGSSVPRVLYGNIYHTPQQQAHMSPSVVGPRNFNLMQKRSSSTKEQLVGPVEFVEMFRSRAYSENHMMEKSSGNYSNCSSSTPDYCPFEPRQVIIWMDSANGTQVFRLPSNEDEEKMIKESPDEEDTPEVAYYKFLKAHPCHDAMPTSTKLVVLDTFLTVKKAFHALNDNKIHAAPLWDTRKQDFIGMLTITDFIRVLLQCHRNKTSILQSSEDHTIAYWAEILSEPQGQELLYVTPTESMYNAVVKLLEYKIHRLPIVDEDAGNILYIVTLKRILRYLYLFFQFYNLPHPSFMNQILSKLKIGTYKNLAVVTPETRLVEALETMIDMRISALPIVDGNNKLIGIFNKNLMMGLDSEEAYADLGIPVGKIFNGSTMVSAKTCMKSEFYQDIIGKLVNSEVHRLVVVDENGRVEGIVSCSDVMRHMVTVLDDFGSVIQVVSAPSMNSD